MKSNLFQALGVFQAPSWAGLHSTILFTPAPARLVPVCGARLPARARGSIRHEEHFVQQPAAAS